MSHNAGDNTADERLTAIETTVAHQDMQIQELNEVIRAQWREIDILKARLNIATSKIEEIETSAQSAGEKLSATEIAARDKPPHY